ncbi:protein Flattop isoform X1 [Cygnus olor]|uniref:protein Flattop isoform X1 n=1 Tax=Cygnus olor TaxID=8869 RepID=UPI001ADE58A9|nr:protein Flattop isoform X1 [Cygnus olor]
MAARYGAGQYEDAFSAPRLQNWEVPQPGRQRPSPRDGSTQILADDRGHLLPSVPRSQASPWGTFLGTWDMPPRIPPAKLNLTARSAAAASRLTGWLRASAALTGACNGLRAEVTGKPQEPWPDAGTSEEPSRTGRGPGEDPQGAQPSPKSPLEEQPGSDCPKPGLVDVRAERDASPEPPASCQPRGEDEQGAGSPAGVLSSPQPGLGDLGGVTAPQIPASATVREAGPQGKGSAWPHRGL